MFVSAINIVAAGLFLKFIFYNNTKSDKNEIAWLVFAIFAAGGIALSVLTIMCEMIPAIISIIAIIGFTVICFIFLNKFISISRRKDFALKQWVSIVCWLICLVAAFLTDFFRDQGVHCSEITISILFLIVPAIAAYTNKVFKDEAHIEWIFNWTKFFFYSGLIICTFVALYKDPNKLGNILTILGATFAIFDLADLKLSFNGIKEEKTKQ